MVHLHGAHARVDLSDLAWDPGVEALRPHEHLLTLAVARRTALRPQPPGQPLPLQPVARLLVDLDGACAGVHSQDSA
eukprot:4850030-Pyramimonas_sp.AAC.1